MLGLVIKRATGSRVIVQTQTGSCFCRKEPQHRCFLSVGCLTSPGETRRVLFYDADSGIKHFMQHVSVSKYYIMRQIMYYIITGKQFKQLKSNKEHKVTTEDQGGRNQERLYVSAFSKT